MSRESEPKNPAAPASDTAVVLIFGKDACPYTQAAIEDHTHRGVAFEYRDVKNKAADLEQMLVYSRGQRRVPVIVQGGKVTIGFGGT
jgi:glutaredoxin